ncbi:MAG: hypothetical protein Q9220_000996 [cf. Caloplaca sp. 1 TL-2023]
MENTHRRPGLSEKFNKLTNNAFNRRRTSAIFPPTESSTHLHRISRIPTPSLGSRTSSLFSGLSLRATDDIDHSETEQNQGKTKQDTASPSASASTRRSHQVIGSTSSFFGNKNRQRLYPKEFLESSEADAGGKENRDRSLESVPGLQNPHNDGRHVSQYSTQLDSEAELNDLTQLPHVSLDGKKQSEDWKSSAKRKSSRISTHLAHTPFLKHRSVRHSIAAVPQEASSRPKEREFAIGIQERRLMAPIHPPLSQSRTFALLSSTSLTATPHSAPSHTPNFMRPTSSSAARRSDSARSRKSPPAPLRLEGRRKSDLPGFSHHRKEEDTKNERRESQPPLPRLPQRYFTRPDLAPSGNVLGVRVPTNGHRPETSSAQQRQIADHADSLLGVAGERRFAADDHRSLRAYADNGSSSSVVQLPHGCTSSYDRQAPRSRIPRSNSTTANLHGIVNANRSLENALQASASELRLPLGAHLFYHSNSSTPFFMHTSQPNVPSLEPQDVFPERQMSLLTAGLGSKGQVDGSHPLHDSSEQQGAVEEVVPNSADDPKILATDDSPLPDHGHSIDEDQAYRHLTEVRHPQNFRYWAGRFTTRSDRMRNEALHNESSTPSGWAHHDRERQIRVLESLLMDCVTEEAKRSLDQFAKAQSADWMVGVLERFQGQLIRDGVVSGGVMEKKKGGFIGKVFGRKKS